MMKVLAALLVFAVAANGQQHKVRPDLSTLALLGPHLAGVADRFGASIDPHAPLLGFTADRARHLIEKFEVLKDDLAFTIEQYTELEKLSDSGDANSLKSALNKIYGSADFAKRPMNIDYFNKFYDGQEGFVVQIENRLKGTVNDQQLDTRGNTQMWMAMNFVKTFIGLVRQENNKMRTAALKQVDSFAKLVSFAQGRLNFGNDVKSAVSTLRSIFVIMNATDLPECCTYIANWLRYN